MDNKEKEVLINKLLVFINDEIEKNGSRINEIYFNFSIDEEDYIAFTNKYTINNKDLITTLNTCISRNYVKEYFGSEKDGTIQLTEEGQGRAISYCNADQKLLKETSNINIGSINSSGAVQIGNNNIQNIENLLTSIIDTINNSSASEEEKAEAKNLLNKFLSHPLVNTLLGSAASVATSIIQG